MVAEYSSSCHVFIHGLQGYIFPEYCFGTVLPTMADWENSVVPHPCPYALECDETRLHEIASSSMSIHELIPRPHNITARCFPVPRTV